MRLASHKGCFRPKSRRTTNEGCCLQARCLESARSKFQTVDVTRYCVVGNRSANCSQLPSTNQSINRIKEKDDHYMASAAVKRVKKKLPERLAEVRGDRSQRQFARDLGVFQQNVNRYENGTTPHTDFLITLSTKENVSLDWLLLGKGRMRRSR